MGTVDRNGENGGRDTHRDPTKNHGGAGAVEDGRDMGDTGGGGSVVSGGDAVSGHLYWPQIGGGVSVGGDAPGIRILHMGYGIQSGGGIGGTHGGVKKSQRQILGQTWRISHGRPREDYGNIGTCSMFQEWI